MKKANSLIVILSMLIVLAVANFLAARHPIRFDLTQNRIYTLSDSTRKILHGLSDIVTIRAYFTEDIPPPMETLRREIDDLLAEFKRSAGRRLQIEFIDPASSVMEEQKAAMMGIPPLQLNVVRRDKQEVAKVYLGMAVLYGDKQEVLPVVQNIGNLEYELAQAIVKVSSKELPSVAWWEGMTGFEHAKELIGKRYKVADLKAEDFSDLDAKKFTALVLASPRDLSDDELFALDQYIMGGGKAIVLIDTMEIGGGLSTKPVKTNTMELLRNYGASVENELVLDRSNARAAFSTGYVTYHIPYPYWPEIRKDQFDQNEPIVAALESAVLPWTSPITITTDKENNPDESTIVLAHTTPYGITVPVDSARIDPQSAGEQVLGGNQREIPIIAMLSGKIRSYFADKSTKVPKGRSHKDKSEETARIFLVGSSHWISDRILANFPANAALFENALDSFAMGNSLIGIRSRGTTLRPIAMFSDGVIAALKYLNIVIGPVIVLIVGLVVFMLRRTKRRAVQIAYRST